MVDVETSEYETSGCEVRMRCICLLYVRFRTAWILKAQRRRAGLGVEEAAKRIGVAGHAIRAYEFGLRSPSLKTIGRLLTLYRASEGAILFFCMAPIGQKKFTRAFLRFLARDIGRRPRLRRHDLTSVR